MGEPTCFLAMESTYIIIILLAAALAAALIAIILTIKRSASEKEKIIIDYEKKRDDLQEEVRKLSSDNARLEAEKARLEAEKKALENMTDKLKVLSAENGETVRRQSAETIKEILKPIQERFSEFDKTVRETQKDSAAQNAAMKANIENVLKHSQAVGDEARNLANAISGRSKIQGDFGEMILTDILKNAGLEEGVHFKAQGVITNDQGKEIKSDAGRTMIPDVMVFYPDDTVVVIDSKVSLSAFNKYMNSESVEDRKQQAKMHVESIRKHVDELKKKDYASYLTDSKRKVNYNIMFIPIEGAFRLMLEEDALLWQQAKDNNVLIVSQMTLIIVLNMIQMAWKQSNQEKNIAEVYKTASELMSQLRGWMENYEKIGKALEDAQKAYSDSKSKLMDSKQSAMSKVRKLEKLGIEPRRSDSRKDVRKLGSSLTRSETIIPESLEPPQEDL